MSPRELFERALPEIDRIIASAGRRLALPRAEADDFRSWVHLRLIENDYAVLRKFAGRSSRSTYLTAVIQNLARDHRIRTWGRWRPSAAAERLGVPGVQLEILLERDGLSLDEAVESLRANHGVRLSRGQIHDLAAKLPGRARSRPAGGEVVESLAGSDRADSRVEEREDRMKLERTEKVLRGALAELEVADRLLLKMHYGSGLRISAIARALGLEQRELYTRRDRCLRELKRRCERAGLEGTDVLDALGRSARALRVDYGPAYPVTPEEAQVDPSNNVEPTTGDDV